MEVFENFGVVEWVRVRVVFVFLEVVLRNVMFEGWLFCGLIEWKVMVFLLDWEKLICEVLNKCIIVGVWVC